MYKKNTIYIHTQDSQAIGGIEIIKFPISDHQKFKTGFNTHRDEYYSFGLLTKGYVEFVCDMENLCSTGTSILFLKPYQVHAVTTFDTKSEGYFITVAPFLIPNDCNDVFQNLHITEQLLKIPIAQKKEIIDILYLLDRSFNEEMPNKQQIINGLFLSFIYRFTNLFTGSEKKVKGKINQARLITAAFQKLITAGSMLEQPSSFAEKLNITTSHLNDCVKETTGISVTQSLQNKMILEAKRQLYYTNNDVKKIAFDLGFEDNAYFSRLFKKICSETPLSFRNKFRE
jgi:AraC family transcriptional activator of pobA